MNKIYPQRENGVIYRAENEMFGYQGWPSVAADENGTLYAVWSGFRILHVCPFGKTCMSVSRDGGTTWSRPMIINDTVLDDRDAGVLCLGGGRMLVTWFNHPAEVYLSQYAGYMKNSGTPAEAGLLLAGLAALTYPENSKAPAGSFVRSSCDGGNTWDSAVKVPVSAPHGPTVLPGGALLYLGKTMYTDELSPGVYAYISSDAGKSWSKLSEVPLPDGIGQECLHEPHAADLGGGRILGMIRCEGKKASPGFTMYSTRSDDGGKSWSTPLPTGVSGSPPHLLSHSSGAVICTFGRREDPFGQRAIVSRDGGESWTEEYILRDDAANGDLGYPATAELPDGSLITVYYQPVDGDRKTSIQYTKWRLS